MKILHVITESNLGGAQRNTLLTVQGLVKHGYEVHLACGPYGPGDATALIREAVKAGVCVRPLPSLVRPIKPLKDLQAAWALLHLMRTECYDVVHTHSTKAGMLGRLTAWLVGVPVIIHTFHGVPFDTRRPTWSTRLCFLSERLLCLFCDKLASVGEVLREELIANRVASPDKIVTVRSGVDFSQLDPASDAGNVRRELGLPASAPVIGFVGRLAEQKAPEVLLHAFAKIANELPEARLLYVGEGPLHGELEAAAQRLGLADRVHLLGERHDVPQLLAVMDLFALPSRWEGVGRALTEAMYMRRPVLTTGVNGVPELVQDGVTGVFVKGDDPSDLALKAVRVLKDPALAASLGQAAHRRVKELMSAESMVQNTIAMYECLFDRKAIEASGGARRVWNMRQTES